MRFKIDWASLINGRKFTVFSLYLRAISEYKPPGGLYLEGRFNGGFSALRVWGAYIWRGLFSEFYGSLGTKLLPSPPQEGIVPLQSFQKSGNNHPYLHFPAFL